MRRQKHRQWIFLSQILIVTGLGLAAFWNVAHLILGWTEAPVWWMQLLLPLPGLLSWGLAMMVPGLLPKIQKRKYKSFRLVYDTPPEWDDRRFRVALSNMIRLGGRVDVVWARDGHDIGCWLLLDDEGSVLRRMIRDLLPGGVIEEDEHPPVGAGVVVLRWKKKEDIPEPDLLCRMDGVQGVFFHWLSEETATVSLWGPGAMAVAKQWAKGRHLLSGQGEGLLFPAFVGDNPWPGLPKLPASQLNPGLSSVSRLELTAPVLRLNGHGGLLLGYDPEVKPVGFSLPGLDEVRQPLRVYGQAAAEVATDMIKQAIKARLPVIVMDGDGGLVAGLARQMLPQMSRGRMMVCDTERPAQSRFRLNPLWLPEDQTIWPQIFSGGWLDWLREMGATPGGLGLSGYRHTQVAATMTAVLAARQGLMLDAPALCEALESPDFLSLPGNDIDGATLLGDSVWQWWLAEGKPTPNFDVHLRLAHLRDRLNALLDLPEYRVLWRGPYLDSLEAALNGTSLLWRLPDPRRRLRGYINSQLLALTTLLATWPKDRPPIVVVLHEMKVESWMQRLSAFSGARLIVSSSRVAGRPVTSTFLVSRLDRADAEKVQVNLPGIRAGDLRRLPDNRLLLRREADLSTIDRAR